MSGWKGPVIDDRYHPWVDDHGHEEAQRRAWTIAHDLVAHRRWKSGANDPVPVYDPTDGSYVGDDSDDQVRSQTHLLRIRQPGYIWASLAGSTKADVELEPGMAEVAYRALLAEPLALAAELRDELIALMAAGRIAEGPGLWDTLRRLVANGYTVDQLRAEVGS